jgi:Zn-dependent peptidase ImmA (M78 family)/DNA-binding XRE family transcriptional regulator
MIGERLRLAREAAGLRQTDAARELGIVESGISQLENGQREPKAAQLAALARLYMCPVEFFFSEQPVVPEVVLWREKPDDEAKTKRIQREFLSLCEDYQDLEKLTGAAAPSMLPLEVGPQERFGYPQAEALAARIWEQFELGAAPAECLRIVLEEKYQVKIFALPLASEASAASTTSSRFGPATLLNKDSRSWRRNFDLAHELFHLLTWSVFRKPHEESSIAAGEDEERLANCFASRLLLPEGPFRERLGPFLDREGALSITFSGVHDLARSFGVSAEAVIYRCAGILHWRKDTTDEIKEKVLALHMWRESPPIESLPSRYVYLVLEAYRQGLISFSRGAAYLRKGHKETRGILEPPERGADFDSPISVAAV